MGREGGGGEKGRKMKLQNKSSPTTHTHTHTNEKHKAPSRQSIHYWSAHKAQITPRTHSIHRVYTEYTLLLLVPVSYLEVLLVERPGKVGAGPVTGRHAAHGVEEVLELQVV